MTGLHEFSWLDAVLLGACTTLSLSAHQLVGRSYFSVMGKSAEVHTGVQSVLRVRSHFPCMYAQGALLGCAVVLFLGLEKALHCFPRWL